MKKLLLSAFVICLAGTSIAQESPLWMRHCALSPDGTTIAFTYKGDIYTVPSTGGRATQITTNPAFDTEPVWSPDSKQIAFASDRMGSLDVFVVSSEGGAPQRLTTHSGSEKPVAYKDNKHILFTANIAPSAEDAGFPSGQFQQVYEVAVTGGRPAMFSSMPMECISINKEGVMLYQDKKGYEDYWRKHQVSPIARDIWTYTPGKNPVYQKQTTFGGEDREPVWSPDGKSFYYLSEEKGSFNIFQRIPGATTSQQITFHTKHPVRFLSISTTGTLCYGYDGEIYTLTPGKQPQKVNISILADKNDKDIIRQIKSNGATDIAVSPKGKEVAFIMRGDVYVTSIDYKTTKQITNTPDQERNISFAPDGRTLVYSSERDGLWQLYTSTIVRKEEKQFTYATELKEERLTNSKVASFQPQFSPDGKEVAFLENRTAIRVINLKSKAVRTVMDAKYQYSYADGDQWFQWSPDSQWILSDFIGIGGWNNKDVVLLKADGKGEMVNLTESGYSDSNAKWVLGGKAMIWNSDRAGYRSHGSWGSEDDTYIMFFDVDAYNRFLMSKEDIALLEEAEKAESHVHTRRQTCRRIRSRHLQTGRSQKYTASHRSLQLEIRLGNSLHRRYVFHIDQAVHRQQMGHVQPRNDARQGIRHGPHQRIRRVFVRRRYSDRRDERTVRFDGRADRQRRGRLFQEDNRFRTQQRDSRIGYPRDRSRDALRRSVRDNPSEDGGRFRQTRHRDQGTVYREHLSARRGREDDGQAHVRRRDERRHAGLCPDAVRRGNARRGEEPRRARRRGRGYRRRSGYRQDVCGRHEQYRRGRR